MSVAFVPLPVEGPLYHPQHVEGAQDQSADGQRAQCGVDLQGGDEDRHLRPETGESGHPHAGQRRHDEVTRSHGHDPAHPAQIRDQLCVRLVVDVAQG